MSNLRPEHVEGVAEWVHIPRAKRKQATSYAGRLCYHASVTAPIPTSRPGPNADLLADLTEPDSAAWDYLSGFESPESYDAFAYYRDAGPARRTLAGTARALGVSPGVLYTWARRYLWVVRAASYDAHRTRERETLRKAAELEVDQDWATRRAELLASLNELALIGAAQLEQRLRTRRGELRPNELVQISRVLMHFGNLANGDATEKVDGLPDYTNMSDEQLREHRAAAELLKRTLGSKDDDGE